MTRHADDVWLFRVKLPAGLPNPGRYMASVLKALGRRFGVKCVAVLDPDTTPTFASGERSFTTAANDLERT